MDPLEAMQTLGVDPGGSFEDARSAYRTLLMAHHPDHSPGADAEERTAAVVEAFRTLREITKDGLVPLPVAAEPLTIGDGPVVLLAAPGDVFRRINDAFEILGEISYVDASTGFVQAVITGDHAPSQLTAEVTAAGSVAQVMFTLDSLTEADAPPIADLVAELAPLLRLPQGLDPAAPA